MLLPRNLTDSIVNLLQNDTENHEIIFLLGTRQTGKTSLTRLVAEASDFNSGETFFFDLEDKEYRTLFGTGSIAELNSILRLEGIDPARRSLLIFDEVMTGFRVAYGGAQALYGVYPDLTCFGKIIGGGLPVGAYGGKHDLMSQVAPQGSVYQAGTLSGNPVAMAAGIATLEQIQKHGFYEALDQKAEQLLSGLEKVARKAAIPVQAQRIGSILGFFFNDRPVHNFDDAKTCNLDRFSAFYNGLRQRGVYVAPSQFEALFVSIAHDTEHIDQTIQAAEEVLDQLI